jgi:hypothetical protein
LQATADPERLDAMPVQDFMRLFTL